MLAGEFGHVPIKPSGPLCGCGRHGCWEVYAWSRAAIGYYADLQPHAPRPTIVELLNMAEDGAVEKSGVFAVVTSLPYNSA